MNSPLVRTGTPRRSFTSNISWALHGLSFAPACILPSVNDMSTPTKMIGLHPMSAARWNALNMDVCPLSRSSIQGQMSLVQRSQAQFPMYPKARLSLNSVCHSFGTQLHERMPTASRILSSFPSHQVGLPFQSTV